MFYGLIKLLGWINVSLGIIAVLFALVLFRAALGSEEGTDRSRAALVLAVALAASCALYSASGIGLLCRKKWGKFLTLGVSGLAAAAGAWQVVRTQWGTALFLLSYAALAGWLLLHPVNRSYFDRRI